MTRGYMPPKDADLVVWGRNITTRISEEPELYHQTVASAAAFKVQFDSFFEAFTTAADPITRTKGTINARNFARDAFKNAARFVALQIQGQPSVTDQQKIDLGLTVRSAPVPIPAPAFSPTVEIISVVGHTVSVRVHGPNTTRRGLPDGCDGIAVFSFAGEICPTDPGKFKFEANTTKMQFDIQFPESVVPGTTVWITAMFFNERKQSGVAANPISTKINFGGMQQVA